MARPKTKKANPKLAVGYVRVSTGRQATNGISLEHQADAVKGYCDMRGLTLREIIVDAGHSAYKQPLQRRADGKRVAALVEHRQVGAIVALRLDRLFRSIRDCINTVMDWDKAGVALHLLDMGGQAIDTSSPMGKLLITMMAGFAEMESYQKAERTRDSWDYKRARGERLGGRPPYGFRMDGGKPVPHGPEQTAIDLIHRLRADGLSIAKIRDRLESDGLPARGSRWHAKTIIRILERAVV